MDATNFDYSDCGNGCHLCMLTGCPYWSHYNTKADRKLLRDSLRQLKNELKNEAKNEAKNHIRKQAKNWK